jgi:hypothetical protein
MNQQASHTSALIIQHFFLRLLEHYGRQACRTCAEIVNRHFGKSGLMCFAVTSPTKKSWLEWVDSSDHTKA